MSYGNYGGLFWRKVIWDFLRTFAAVVIPGLAGAFEKIAEQVSAGSEPVNVDDYYVVFAGLIIAGISAGFRAVQARFTHLESANTPNYD